MTIYETKLLHLSNTLNVFCILLGLCTKFFFFVFFCVCLFLYLQLSKENWSEHFLNVGGLESFQGFALSCLI